MNEKTKALMARANEHPDGIMWRMHYLGARMLYEGRDDDAEIIDEASAFIRELVESMEAAK